MQKIHYYEERIKVLHSFINFFLFGDQLLIHTQSYFTRIRIHYNRIRIVGVMYMQKFVVERDIPRLNYFDQVFSPDKIVENPFQK